MARVLLTLLLLMLPAVGSAVAAPDVPVLKGYTVTSWTAGEGVSFGPVRALAQDHDGYLWLGTDTGLYRFDGFHFAGSGSVPGIVFPERGVRALHVARNGDVWVGLAEGEGIYRLQSGRLSEGGRISGVTGAVNAFAEDVSGTLWAAHDGGLLERRPNGWTPMAGAGFGGARVLHVRAGADALYIGTSAGLYVSRRGRAFSKVDTAGDDIVRGSMEDAEGTTWVTDPWQGFRTLEERPRVPHTLAGRGSQFLRDSKGNIWLATVGQGLWRIATGRAPAIERLTVQNGLLTDGIWALLEDREGNLWVGTHEGLNRLTPHTMTPLTQLGVTSSVVPGRDGVMWVASTDGVVAFATRSGTELRRTIYPVRGARTVHADARGNVWAAGADGLLRLADGHFRPVPLPPGLPLNRITAITSDSRGVVWFADVSQGAWQLDGTTFTPYALPERLRPLRITALHGDATGVVWIAFEEGRLGAVSATGTFKAYGAAQGLAHTNISGIGESDWAGVLVTGTAGVSRLVNGRFVTIGRNNRLPSRVLGVVEDAGGSLWLSMGDIGIARMPRDEAARAFADPGYQLHLQLFDTSDGMAGMPTSLDSKTVARDGDGRLWFVTGRGLTLIDPRVAVLRPRASGPARVETVVADERRFDTHRTTTLPAGTNRVRIDYTALNLTAPEHTRFRYRLEGFDDAWRDAGPRRQAFYTNLPPRDYRFVVQAEAADGSSAATSANWSFTIAPRFYQTRTFYALSGLALVVLIATAWQLRLRHVRREFAIVLAERARLSREMHDTLLQSMVGISLKIDNAAITGDPQSRSQLVTIRRDIEDCIVEARQTILNMRGGDPGHADLIAALEQAGTRATAGTEVRFKLTVAGTPFRASQGIESELLRIAQEALTNAVRHAHPTHVAMELRYDRGSVSLRVVDDGTGFEDVAPRESRHFGLATMRERAEQLGGEFRLTSATGSGTQIEAIIPL